MKPARLVVATLAVAVACAWAVSAFACDRNKTTQASAASKSGVCTAEMAAHCTPEMAAACKAKGAAAVTAAAAGTCAAHSAARTAAAGACPHHQAAVTAVYSGSGQTGAVTAGAAGTCDHKASAVTAGTDHCAGKGANASAAGNGSCSGWGMGRMAGQHGHGDCDAGADLFSCEQELAAAGAKSQVVPLKNGVMFVYTAESPGAVNAVQSAMSRRNERLAQFQRAGDKAHLCAECKSMRGAVASGKLLREVINIEGGALTLMTSDDPKIVAKIHALIDTRTAARVKS